MGKRAIPRTTQGPTSPDRWTEMVAEFTLRGVRYSAQVLADGRVELRVAGELLTDSADVTVTIGGWTLLGGDEKSAIEIYRGLQRAMLRRLAEP